MDKTGNIMTIIRQAGDEIMICFTLYCFARIFDISYSGATAKLTDFFNGVYSDALTKIVTAQTRSNKYVKNIDIISPRAKALIDSILPERVQYVYKKVIENSEKEKSVMVYELLKYALQQDQSVQREIYINRETEEIKNYIYLMKNMRDTEVYSEKQTKLSNEKILTDDKVITETVPVIDTSKMTVDNFFSFVENHIADIRTLQIGCHVGDMWHDPHSRRYAILRKLCDFKSEIKVIINSQTAVEDIFKHMRDENAYKIGMYHPLDKVTYIWNELAKTNINMQVKKCSYPLLHNYICCEFQGNINSIMRVGLYTYGDSISDNKPHFNISSNDGQYELLKSEFEYLWNISE